jgi:agmatinase
MRRLNEQVRPAKIIEVGTRAICKEELAYARKADIQIITTQQIKKQGTQQINKQLKKQLEPYRNVYLTVDMDILDPAYVPAAQNPEPEGLETTQLLDILEAACDHRVNAFDVLEIAPNYDQGISALQTTKIINELLCLKQKTKQAQRHASGKQKQER